MSGGFGEAPPGWSEHGSSPSGARLLRPYTNRTSLFGVDVDAGDGAAATDKQDDETPIQRLERGERDLYHKHMSMTCSTSVCVASV